MTIVGFCRPLRGARDRAYDRCYQLIPCLSDPARRSSLVLQIALVTVHIIFVGVLFIFDRDLIEKTIKEPWYTAIYLFLFVATLAQYFLTAGSSPGYVVDAMAAANEAHAIFTNTSMTSKQSASSKNGSLTISVEGNQLGRTVSGPFNTPWTKLVMDMYPPGSSIRNWTCTYCSVVQPPRAKHCHDCDKCVLQFDHHCVWLGTCIGQGNHCRFWWYIFEETIMCLWTGVLYISYLRADIPRAWWNDVIVILFLATLSICLIFLLLLLFFHSYLILTNQTTYELVRRRRIPYLRGIPERVYPFSKGICRNLYNFCCASDSMYGIEPLPNTEELEEKSRPVMGCGILQGLPSYAMQLLSSDSSASQGKKWCGWPCRVVAKSRLYETLFLAPSFRTRKRMMKWIGAVRCEGERCEKMMITRSNLAEQLREYQVRSKLDWATDSFFTSTTTPNLNSSVGSGGVVMAMIVMLVLVAVLVVTANGGGCGTYSGGFVVIVGLVEWVMHNKNQIEWPSDTDQAIARLLCEYRVDVVIVVIWELIILAFLVFSAVSLYFSK
ncbi:zinc finger protein [Macleaya cordata]|uniref:S-acyltransferase n=2 Tax=Magnoliopsida TaxID=3398 RepID=A0A200QZW2_MACCD|nr:zinc finger protein [Macleaya cordata]